MTVCPATFGLKMFGTKKIGWKVSESKTFGLLPALREWVIAGAALLAGVACSAGGDEPLGPSTKVTVMTRNVDLGSSITEVVSVRQVAEIATRAEVVRQNILASNLPERVALVADEIAQRSPDVVALQEAIVFHIQTPSDFDLAAPLRNAGSPGVPGSVFTIDVLAILQSELGARGLAYQVAVVGSYSDVELPAATESGMVDVRLIDRKAILVKPELAPRDGQATVFTTGLPNFPLGSDVDNPPRIDIIRGFESVTLTKGAAQFTVINTHLEAGTAEEDVGQFLSAIQEGQARELRDRLADDSGPLVLLGDINSNTNTTDVRSHQILREAGFKDAVSTALETPQVNCCTDLNAPAFTHTDRQSVVMYRGRVEARAQDLTGSDINQRTSNGRLASEHAGVWAELAIENNL